MEHQDRLTDIKPTDPDKFTINTATLNFRRDLRETVEAMDRANLRLIAPWRNQIQKLGIKESARLLRDHGMQVTGLSRTGFFTSGDGMLPGQGVDEVRRAIEEAVGIGTNILTIVVGGLLPGSRDIVAAHEHVAESLSAVLPDARASGVALAIEPLHPMYAADRGCVNTVGHANALCEKLGAGVGIAVDIYHVWWDPGLEEALRRAGERLMGFHLCDWLVPTADMLLDRGMMGDGVADIPRIRSWMERSGYSGPQEVEIFSAHNWWKRDPDEVLQICKERYAAVC